MAKATKKKKPTKSSKPSKPGKSAKPSKPKANGTVSAWEQDPGSKDKPDGGQLIQVPTPVLGQSPFSIAISNPPKAPNPTIYSPGTDEFRYWALAAALTRGKDFWGKQLPGVSWEVGNQLPVDMDHGEDLNAYYDRVGLRFFHGTAAGRTVFSCESPDVVCHEQGHAILDSIKPELWDAASLEVAAFHESFGDMSAILTGLQVQSLRSNVLAETGGNFFQASRLSRLAEQLGWAIRQSFPTAVEADCLRNAVNSFFYRDPQTLPSNAPATSLSSEPHSFSRVFTGAFYEGLAGMFKIAGTNESSLQQASLDMAKILTTAIKAADVVPGFYSQVAANMIDTANSQFATNGYAQALRSAFIRHGILSPSSSLAPVQNIARAAMANTTGTPRELPKLSLSITEFGLGIDSILVHSASDSARFNVAGAALSKGEVTAPGHQEEAKAFIEDLLRRGRLAVPNTKRDARSAMVVTRASAPEDHQTHTHELQKQGNDFVLKRVRIDCGFYCTSH